MIPTRAQAVLTGGIVAAIVAGAGWGLAVDLVLAAVAGLFCGLAVASALWAVPRIQWNHEVEPTAGAREFAIVAGASILPTLAIVPVFALDGLPLADRVALVALVLGVGFTGYGGAMTVLVASHRHTGGQLVFATGAETTE